jgi:acyl carrier protein
MPINLDRLMTRNEAVTWLAELFEEPADNVQPDTTLDAIPTWDSLGVLTLLAGLSDRFDVTVEVEELGRLATINDILAVLQRAGKLD